MLFAYGWAIVQSSRAAYETASGDELEHIDDLVKQADEAVYADLEAFLSHYEPPDLDWHLRRHMNNARGILTMSSSRNHRGLDPTVLTVLAWLARNAPGSYGLVYLHDDEDAGEYALARGRDGTDHTDAFRVWRLLQGIVEEFDDPFLSPIIPKTGPAGG
jgi:hypothetical protein